MEYHKFIVMAQHLGGGLSHWGIGDTIELALDDLSNEVSVQQHTLTAVQFTSALPFAPPSRAANENESNCWIDQYGHVHNVRCTCTDASFYLLERQ